MLEILLCERFVYNCNRAASVVVMGVKGTAPDQGNSHRSEEIGSRPAEVRHQFLVGTRCLALDREAVARVLLAERQHVGGACGLYARDPLNVSHELSVKL